MLAEDIKAKVYAKNIDGKWVKAPTVIPAGHIVISDPGDMPEVKDE